MDKGSFLHWTVAIASLSIEFYSDSLPRRERREGRKPWHGIIPRDFRSEYSLAGHSFQSVTFAMAKRVEQFLLSLDDRGPRRHDNKVSTFTDPGLVSDHRFRVMLVRITMLWCIRSIQSRSIVCFLRWWSVRMKRADLERDCCEILSNLFLEKLHCGDVLDYRLL